jgi:sulfide:quinone oxidoreductase
LPWHSAQLVGGEGFGGNPGKKTGFAPITVFKLRLIPSNALKILRGAKPFFHNPHTPVKCGGAPHKIMYLAADYFRKHGILGKADIQYWSGAAKLFAVPVYEKTLLQVVKRGNIKLNFMQRLEEIDGPNKRARFVGFGEDNKDVETWVDFDMIHVTPPQGPPDLYKKQSFGQCSRLGRCGQKHAQACSLCQYFSL